MNNKYSNLLDELIKDIKDEILLIKNDDLSKIKDLIEIIEAKGE